MVTVLSTGPYWNANFNFQNAKHIWQYLTFDFAAIRNLSTTIEEVQVPKNTKICQSKFGFFKKNPFKKANFVELL